MVFEFLGRRLGFGNQAPVRAADGEHLASQAPIINTFEGSSTRQGTLRPTQTENIQGTANYSFEIDPNSILGKSYLPNAYGGFADVYKCSLSRDASAEQVAVKCPRFPNLSKEQTDKVNHNLDREISIWAELEHQYVLPLRGTTKKFGPFRALVSPWMSNGTLASYLDRRDVTFTMIHRLQLLKQIAEGLKYLHDNNVIHGDLNDNNVLIADDGSPRLADFGISNIIIESNLVYSYHTGAVRWVAPELINIPEGQTARRTTKSSDIYSLGCIVLRVLYGRRPYWWTEDALQFVAAKFNNREPINSTIDIPAHHLSFMRRCWSTTSEESRPSVEEVLDFLGEAISNRGTST